MGRLSESDNVVAQDQCPIVERFYPFRTSGQDQCNARQMSRVVPSHRCEVRRTEVGSPAWHVRRIAERNLYCGRFTGYPSVTTCVLPNTPTELRPCWVLRQRQYQQFTRLGGRIDSSPNLVVSRT